MSLKQLKQYSQLTNIAEELEDIKLLEIGNKVNIGYQEDYKSSEEWLSDVKKVEELASLAAKQKNTPLPNSANIKYPLITKACYEFSSRTYPEIIRDGKVVKVRVLGKDLMGEKLKRAERVADFMNYQLLIENQEWELELDRLLNLLALIGFICKKTYYDPVRKMIKSEICDYKDLIINSDIKSLDDARRISHVIHLRLNDLIENKRAEVFLADPVDDLIKQYEKDELDPCIDVIEQHTYLDLDEDGYTEPYIVTIIKNTNTVLRIAPRYTEDSIKSKNDSDEVLYINPLQIYTDYHFLVSPSGKFQSVGFGILMLHLNETINTILNQLVDAGQLANLRGGYIDSRLKPLGSAETLHDPGEWKAIKSMMGVTLRDGILPIDYKEPSSVLYQLLGLLIEASRDLSSSTDIMTGNSSPQNAKSGATLALIQEGMKVATSIHKRIYRSLTSEYKKIFKLNKIYQDPKFYFNVLDDEKGVLQEDFDDSSLDVTPVADPNLASEYQRSQKNQTLLALASLPGYNPIACARRVGINSNIDNIEELMLPEEAMNKPNPEMLKLQADIQSKAEELHIAGRRIELEEKRFLLDKRIAEFEMLKMQTEAGKNIAQAEAAEAGTNMQQYQQEIDVLQHKIETILQYDAMNHEQQMQSQDHLMRANENAANSPAVDGTSSNQGTLPLDPGAQGQ